MTLGVIKSTILLNISKHSYGNKNGVFSGYNLSIPEASPKKPFLQQWVGQETMFMLLLLMVRIQLKQKNKYA
jgi:hypothetical protein